MSDGDWRGGNPLPDGTHVCELIGFKRVEKGDKDLVIMEWCSVEGETIGDEVAAIFNILFSMGKKEFIKTCSALWPETKWTDFRSEALRLENTGIEARLNIQTDRKGEKEFRRVVVVERLGGGVRNVNLDEDPFKAEIRD